MFRSHDRRRPPLAVWPPARRIRAVLCGRDGTLIEPLEYNGDPRLVQAMPDARAGLDRLRSSGMRMAIVTNQSGLGRGFFSRDQLDAVNARVLELVGPFEIVCVCAHRPSELCGCRKPAPGLVLAAASHFQLSPDECVVIGTSGNDLGAARSAGAAAILIAPAALGEEQPNPTTGSCVAGSFSDAVHAVLEYA